MPDKPKVEDHPVRCRKCDRVFKGYVYKIVPTAKEITVLTDADGDVVYDLVKTCGKCQTVYHWHSNDKTLEENTKKFQILMETLYSTPPRSAIITSENPTG